MAKSRSPAKPTKDATLDSSARMLILCGPEEMLKREAWQQFCEAINKEFSADIEAVSFDGKTAEPALVFDELRTPSMFQPYRLVVVDNADEWVKSHRDLVERYAENPAEAATLVLRSTNWNSPKLDKLVEKVGAKVKMEPVPMPEAVAWLVKRATTHHDRKLSKDCAQTLVARLGCGLLRLNTELAKLALLVGDGEAIEKALIDQTVGRSSDEQVWAVQEALLAALASPPRSAGASPAGRMIEALHELVDLADHPSVLVLYFVADMVRKLHLANMLRRQRVSDSEIASQLKLWGPRRNTFFAVLNRLSPDASAAMLQRIVRYDRGAKSGLGDFLPNLECFCATLADELR
ncbi:MAG: DNA polymerase III subunit delta [Phycisphaeraceae bacterium]